MMERIADSGEEWTSFSPVAVAPFTEDNKYMIALVNMASQVIAQGANQSYVLDQAVTGTGVYKYV